MAKPDPALLDSARYPFTCRIEPRFGDLDTNMHINNVALVGILEEARVRFHRASGYHRAQDDIASMVASFAVEFLGQSFYPDALDISVASEGVGRTSHVVSQLATQNGQLVAFARSVIVSTRDGRPVELPESFRHSVQSWMLRQ